MPAEWEPHRATWIGWPHHEPDWPGKLGPIPWVYAEIVRVLADHETGRDPLSRPTTCRRRRARRSTRTASGCDRVRPARRADRPRLAARLGADRRRRRRRAASCSLNWAFNGWAKYDNWQRDAEVGAAIARDHRPAARSSRSAPDRPSRVVLEGGGIEVNGDGLLLVTEEWLLSDVQVRNPGLTRSDYERLFAEWLGVRHTIWLGEGCVGDDTHGHVDDIARFVSRGHDRARRRSGSGRREPRAVDRQPAPARARVGAQPGVGPLRIVTLPFPRPVDHERRAAAGQLRELLHRQRRRARADVQRSQRSRRAEHARRADAVTSRSSASTPSISSGASARCTA